MPLYGQHVTPRQAMTHLTFSQIELSWTGGRGGRGGAGVNTRTSSLHGALFRGEIVAIYVLPGHHISILFTLSSKNTNFQNLRLRSTSI